MRVLRSVATGLLFIALGCCAAAAQKNDMARKDGDFTLSDFTFHDGAKLALSMHYTTLGDPKSPAVLVLHGTNGNGAGLLSPDFGGELFGPGQSLDAAKYFIILPDMIGAGKSTKPSDGLKMHFPRYNYDDMVAAAHRLLTEGLKVKHLRLVMGQSMGGMLTWVWGETYPDFADGLVPLAATPAAMSGRNWLTRRMFIETVKSDPAWNNGDYTSQPNSLKIANAAFGFATSGGNQGLAKRAPTREAADKMVEAQLSGPVRGDANDAIYQMDASRDFDPVPKLAAITAPLLAITSADDERNPPETGRMQRGIAQVKKGQAFLIPASGDTRGHGTTGMARLWKERLVTFLGSLKG
jgi:homoserine O-acetyltransferase